MEQPKQRNTKQRAMVLDAVRAHYDHPTAEQIYQDVHAQNERVSRATVYRNLNLLSDNGDIMQIDAPVASRFDLRTDPHYHMVCTRCGSVCDAPLEYQAAYDELIAQETGFKIACHQTLFEGLCPACQEAQEQQ